MRTIGLAYLGVAVLAITAFLQGSAAEMTTAADPEGRLALRVDRPSANAARSAITPPSAPAIATPPPGTAPPADPGNRPDPAAGSSRAIGSTPTAASGRSTVPSPPRSSRAVVSDVGPTPGSDDAARRGTDPDVRRRDGWRDPAPVSSPDEWLPPEGPIRIGLQAGHWRADEAPRELSGLKGGGTSWQSTPEWQANLEIVRRAGRMLEELGYEVDLLPAVIPPGYRAHLFISVHADGSSDPKASGYRVAAPRSDATGRAERVARLLGDSYGQATGLRHIPTATRRMRNYYAFNYRRYEHALDPRTIGVILETGFMTSERDRNVILNDPDRAARGIVDAVASFEITPPPVAAGSR